MSIPSLPIDHIDQWMSREIGPQIVTKERHHLVQGHFRTARG
jgi:hypothetical protein